MWPTLRNALILTCTIPVLMDYLSLGRWGRIEWSLAQHLMELWNLWSSTRQLSMVFNRLHMQFHEVAEILPQVTRGLFRWHDDENWAGCPGPQQQLFNMEACHYKRWYHPLQSCPPKMDERLNERLGGRTHSWTEELCMAQGHPEWGYVPQMWYTHYYES